MPLQGLLEEFPLSDIIQMIYVNRKSGILYITCSSGESQLVFHEGFIVSANHLNGRVRIGTILVGMSAITNGQLKSALLIQEMAGKNRKPLIATMLDQEMIDRDTAYKGLEKLIETTLVEIFSWSKGEFLFDQSNRHIPDEYKYFPEKLHRGILLNAQFVLMESLRIFDEKNEVPSVSKPDLGQQYSPEEQDVLNFLTIENAQDCHDSIAALSGMVEKCLKGIADETCEQPEQAGIAVDHQGEMVSYLTAIADRTKSK